MDSIKEKKSADAFPLESLYQLKAAVAPEPEKETDYQIRNYDNRERFSNMAHQLGAKLDGFQNRIRTSAFLSDEFSWRVNSARTEDPDRLLAKAASFALSVDYSLHINQLATSWQTVSDRFVTQKASDLASGIYTYTLQLDEAAFEIDVEIENNLGDPATNRDVLLAVERSINRLGLDVTASLEEFQKNDRSYRQGGSFQKYSYLKVTRNSTGENLSVNFSDVDGDLIKTLGLNRTTRFAHNSQYRLNGVELGSDSNTLSFASGKVAAHLAGITGKDENLKITIDRDARYLALELESVIEDFNELINWIDDNESVISQSLKTVFFSDLNTLAVGSKTIQRMEPTGAGTGDNSKNFINDLGAVMNIDADNVIDSDLSEIGLTLTPEGRLEISEAFASAVKDNLRVVYDTLSGPDGFFKKIAAAISDIQDRPSSQYVMQHNSVLSYQPEGTGKKSIYQNSSGGIISYFA